MLEKKKKKFTHAPSFLLQWGRAVICFSLGKVGRKMKQIKYKGEIGTAYGQPLDQPIKFESSFEGFETADEVLAAKENPTGKELVNFANAKRKAADRAKVTDELLEKAGYSKPVVDETEAGRLLAARQLMGNLIKTKVSEAEAKTIAEATFRVTIPSE